MPNSLSQNSFTGGELAPSAGGRVDLARYQTSLKTCRNFLTRVQGGAVNRPGTGFVCTLKDQTKRGRLIPFQFSTTQGYCLQFEDGWLRVVKDGGQVLFSSGPNVGLPFEVASPYTEAQLPNVKYTRLNDVMTLVHTGVRPKQLSRSAHDAWTFSNFAFQEGPFQDINITKTKGLTAGAETGNGVTIKASASIFASDMVGQLFYVEQKDFGKPWEVGKSVAKGDIRRADGKYYEALTAGTTGTLRPTVDTTGDTESDGEVTWQYRHSGYGIAEIATFASASEITVNIISRLPKDVVGIAVEKTITGAANNGSGLIRITTSAAHGYADDDSILVYGVLGTVEANGIWQVDVINTTTYDLKESTFVNAYTSGGKSTNKSTYKWAVGAWGGSQGWPGAVTYFQQREAFAGTPAKPTGLWLSVTNAFTKFGRSTPSRDDDAISMTLAADEANAIRHMLDLGKLVVLTAGGKFVLPDNDNSPILTPSQRSARPQGSLGASDVRPAKLEDSILYVLDKGQTVHDLAYDFASDAYRGKELSVLAQHLLEGHTVVAAAYQHVPNRCHWLVRDDGVLVGLTYLREHEVSGFHQHDTDGGFFEDVCVVSEPPEDAVYFIVRRVINGVTKRYIERLKSRLYTDVKDAVFLDSSLTYDGRNKAATTMTLTSSGSWTYNGGATFTLTSSVAHFAAGDVNGDEIHFTANDGTILRMAIKTFTSNQVVTVTLNRDVATELRATAITSWGHAKKAFAGLDHLEAETVGVVVDGHVHPQRTVASGAIALQYAGVVVHAGLPIEADLETLDMNVIGQEVRDKQKLVNKVTLIVEASKGIWAGPDEDHLIEYKQRNQENYDEPVDLLTGQAEVYINSTWSRGGRVFVRQSDPVPLSVLGAIPSVSVGG